MSLPTTGAGSSGRISYYVDATSGNDASDGRSPDQAWQTIGKVNGKTFEPGDHILFKRGETWQGTALIPSNSGIVGRPIVFGDYGDGAKPIIDGNDTVNCIEIAQGYLTFNNIRAIDGLDFGFYCQGSANYITMTGCEADGCGNDNVIFIDGAHHCTVTDLVSTNPYDRAGAGISCLEVADGSHDITISNSTLTGSAKYGVQILAHTTEEFPYNVTIEDCQISSNTLHGVYLHMSLNSTLPASPEVIIQDCTIEDNVNAGLLINVIGGGATYPVGAIIRRNVIQDNYADGSGYSVTIRGADHYLGYNLIAATQIRGMIWNNTSNLEAERNTLYVPSGAGFQALLGIAGTLSGLVAKNNIWATDVTTVIVVVDAVGVAPANSDMDYNLHYTPSGAGANRWNWNAAGNSTYANWLTNSGQDANSPTPADPLFVDAAGGDFALQAGSPARGAGQGGVDCGAYPYTG